ncbi:right-handed parallel beta-helix repeat-containing protein [Mesobaculum littorinae]|uniref:Right-handed parallel beta-helix repeat-containing protein n=1 Tax=Mesobaculum littorinae TaxID=2486419 RepID=A0A438AGD4_9RHOB|nr:glycosyl hydrolase family 28-related protein [Mesobaculum littorinae]RVV97758.1 right-handed parallel beta-helix repeat-containing protein [Mesobaculum littorinae]
MNKAITDGLELMPPPFANGLDVFSRGNGTPGTATYDTAASAAYVPADQDFGGCLELVKTDSVQRLRYTGETPILPGTYLRVRTRVKAISGNLPSVRIAGWAGGAGGAHVGGLTETGPSVALTSYGEVVEVSAIIGVGNRGGVDMVWGRQPLYGHFGLDLTGPTGGVVRIDDLVIEDITTAFLPEMLDFVDVRDYGARGNGSTDDSAAVEAADAAADGRALVFPEGVFRLDRDVTLESPARFVGRVEMPAARRLVLRRNFDFPSYAAAFGDEETGLKKALQALFNNVDHDSLDLGGRQIEIDAPIDVAAVVGSPRSFEIRRVVRNGQLKARDGAAWGVSTVTRSARYNRSSPNVLTNVASVGGIEVGARVSGQGVGREVYVRAKNAAAGTVTLSQPLYAAASTQDYGFTRFRYLLDFSGFEVLSKFLLTDIEFQLNGVASGILLAPQGKTFQVRDCVFNKPRHRGITSHASGCQNLQVDRTEFISNEQGVRSTQRQSVAINVNENDPKIRDNRFARMGISMVLAGAGNSITGNHWFQGDSFDNSPRQAGLLLTRTNCKTFITGNYIDNNIVEWSNEHDATPDQGNDFSFGALTITGNIFTANDVARSFSWLVIRPRGQGHFVQGLSVTGNVFRTLNGAIARVDRVNAADGALDMSRSRLIEFRGNTFNGVDQETVNPVTLEFTQTTPQGTWTLTPGAWLPFDGWTRTVEALTPQGRLRNSANVAQYVMPGIDVMQGAGNDQVRLQFPEATKGKVQLTVRMDRPY